MRWIVDAQLPPALAGMLREHGHQADHVDALGMREASDREIWDCALENGAIIVTKDEDFPSRSLVAPQTPVLVWLRIGNCSRKALLAWFEPLLPAIEKRIHAGETLVEIR